MDKMNNNTLRITTGAMILALFAMLLLMNRQTGGLFEGFFIYILPIPMVIYSAKFDWKSGLMVFAGMCAFSLFFGTLTSIFYAISSALLGLIFGALLYKKADMTVTMFIVMGISGTLSIISNVALASVFGYNLTEDITYMQNMMTETFQKSGIDVSTGPYALLMSDNSMLQLFIFSMFIAGLFDGFIVYKLSTMILMRLHYPLQKSRPLAELYPPKWSGILAIAAYLYGSMTFTSQNSTVMAQNVGQSLWIIGYLYLVLFGVIAGCLILTRRFGLSKGITALICVLCTFMLPQMLTILGLMYVTFNLHDMIMEYPPAK